MSVAFRAGRATLATVAASAGVSVATVSKVVNGRHDVSPATRAMVQQLLHEHQYVGRRVVPAVPATVELFFHGHLNAYHDAVFQGVLETAAAVGVAVVVSIRPRGQRSSRNGSSGAWARELASAGRQAAIAVTSELAPADLTALARAGLPLVHLDPINMPHGRATSIGSTNFAGGLAA